MIKPTTITRTQAIKNLVPTPLYELVEKLTNEQLEFVINYNYSFKKYSITNGN